MFILTCPHPFLALPHTTGDIANRLQSSSTRKTDKKSTFINLSLKLLGIMCNGCESVEMGSWGDVWLRQRWRSEEVFRKKEMMWLNKRVVRVNELGKEMCVKKYQERLQIVRVNKAQEVGEEWEILIVQACVREACGMKKAGGGQVRNSSKLQEDKASRVANERGKKGIL